MGIGSGFADFRITTKQDSDDSHLAVLIEDYKTSVARLEQNQQNVYQIIGLTTPVLGVALGFFISNPERMSTAIAWLIPALFCIVFSLLLIQTGIGMSYLYTTRILSQRINALFPEIMLTQFMPGYPASSFFSLFRGNAIYRTLNPIIFGIAIAGSIWSAAFCFRFLYFQSHLAGTIFAFVYTVLYLLIYAALWSILSDLPRRFSIVSKELELYGRMPRISSIRDKIMGERFNSMEALFYRLVPRPFDIAVKAPFHWYGFAFAYLAYGMIPNRLMLVSTLFEPSSSWTNTNQIPALAATALGGLAWLVSELFLQQGKLLWDDVRDTGRDRKLALNKSRAVARGLISRSSAQRQIFFRLAAGIIFGYLLGGVSLVLVFFVILLHQAVYALWGKPRAEKHPVTVLAILSFNVALRYLTGLVVVLGGEWAKLDTILFFVLFYFQSFGATACLWRIEEEYNQTRNLGINIRAQGSYYLRDGLFWQRWGLIAAVVSGVATVYMYMYLHGSTVGPPYQSNMLILFLGFIIAWILVGVFFCVEDAKKSRLHLLSRLGTSGLTMALAKLASMFSVIAFFFTAAFTCIALISGNGLYVILSAVALNIGYIFLYENFTYENYTLDCLYRKVGVVRNLINTFLFEANSEVKAETILRALREPCEPK